MNGTESEVVYVWDIPYSFNGDFSIKGAIPISKGLIDSSDTYFIDLYYTIYSSGLFAQQTTTQNYQQNFTIVKRVFICLKRIQNHLFSEIDV